MADNYLENRMADYRSGQTSASVQAAKATRTAIKKNSPSVLIVGGETEKGKQLIRYFRSLGWRVAFTHPALTDGRTLAQTTGAQHHPIDPMNGEALNGSICLIAERWGHLDMIVNCLENLLSLDGSIPVLNY